MPLSAEQHSRVSQPVFLGVLWTLTGISFLFVLFRIYVQTTSFRRLFIDDFLVILAWMIILTAAVIWTVEGKVLYELYAISAGEQLFNPSFLPRYNTFMRFLAPFEILFYSALWCIKFSFMALFFRLSAQIKFLRVWWSVVLFATVSVYIASVGDIEYACSFGGIEFIINQCTKLKHIHYENRSFWANCAGDVITDLMILSIPTLLLWNTRISRRKKCIVLSVFSATILVMVVAVIRVAIDNSYSREINIAWLCFWSFVEVDVAIIISCVVSFRQLFINTKKQSSHGTPYTPSNPNSNDPVLKYPKKIYSHSQSQSQAQSIRDVEAPEKKDMLLSPLIPLSPLSMVYVRHEFEVAKIAASETDESVEGCRSEASLR